MLPECRLLHEVLSAFNRIIVKEIFVIIVAKVVWIGQTIITDFAGFPIVDAYRIEYFDESLE